MTSPLPVASTRRYDLDWVRIAAFALLVLYHVGMYYVSWDFHVKSPHAGHALEPFMLLSAPWRLSLLFLLSGVASTYLFAKQPEGFMGARSRRLLIPLLFGVLVIVPPQAYYEVVEKFGYADGYAAFYRRYLLADQTFCGEACLVLPTWNHLWFVAYLWVYTLLAWVLLRKAGLRMQRMAQVLSSQLSGPGLLLWPALFLGLARIGLLDWFGSTHALVDDWYNHAQYLGIFLLGLLIARTESVWQRIQQLRWTALLLAALSYAFLIGYFSYAQEITPSTALRKFQGVIWGLNQWCSIVAVLGFARQFAPGDSPARRYLSDAVFPVYILHQTVIVILTQQLKPLAINPVLEGVLLCLATYALCFAAYELLRRVGWLRPLFGLKRYVEQVTAHTAWQIGEDAEKGSLSFGKQAAFVVLATGPVTSDPANLLEINVVATINDGEPINGSRSLGAD